MLNKLNKAIPLAHKHIQSHILPNGRFLGGCKGRVLETSLTLHLLHVLGSKEELQQKNEQYLRDHVLRLQGGSRANYLDRLLSLVLAKGVLNEALTEDEVDHLTNVLGKFSHPTQWRKLALINALLAEVTSCNTKSLEVAVVVLGDFVCL